MTRNALPDRRAKCGLSAADADFGPAISPNNERQVIRSTKRSRAMPIPKGRPQVPPNLRPIDTEARMLLDMEWALDHGKDPNAKAPCYSAQHMLNYYRRMPKTFVKQYWKFKFDKLKRDRKALRSAKG
jgi:hypothetical protein